MMAVDPAKAPASYLYKERTYYFCNRGCKEAFLKDPEQYL
jgi:Cu+-exporting ATPase